MPSVGDQSRTVSVTAVFTSRFKTALGPESRHIGGISISPLVNTSEPIFSFSREALPFPMLRSYRITRCCSGETFEVTGIEPDGVARIVVKVVQLGKQNYEER